MRARTTWNMGEILNRTAATTRTADPYAMNQDHLRQQPSADKYLTGDPSAFAEDITTPNNWEVEYSGGAVKRNEIGMPEDRPDTYNHPEKTAATHDVLLKKADLTVRIARRMLGANAPEGAVEEQAAALMHLPDQEVINTYSRLAGEMPPALKEHMEQKQQGAKQEQAGQGEEQQAQEQAKQAAIRGDKAAFDAAVARIVKLRSANGQQQPAPQQGQGQQQAGQQQQQAGQDQQSAWYDTKAPRPGHPGPDSGPYAGQQVPPPAFQQQQSGLQNPQVPSPNLQQQGGQQQFPGGQQWGDGGQQAGQGQPQMPMQAQQPQQGIESTVQQMIEQAAQEMGKQANDPQQAPAQQQQAGQQQQGNMQQQGMGYQQQAGQGQQMPPQQQAGQQQQAQGQPQQQAPAQQQQAQVQQQGAGYQQAQGQPQQPPMQQQANGLTNPNQNVSPNMMPTASDDQLLDQMLMGDQGGAAPAAGPIAEMDIQMEAPSMDIGEVAFQPGEDAMLRQLFSNDEAMAAQQVQEQQQAQGQQQQVQASNVRTAALRTVGTRPSAGVSRIGGAGAPPARGQEVDKLTSLWQSAPDVREVFGLK